MCRIFSALNMYSVVCDYHVLLLHNSDNTFRVARENIRIIIIKYTVFPLSLTTVINGIIID